ncbi:DUF7269 family protein [Natrononativus amylolyticus]|uniref:DUF7269 family protein n=1 Tax=Natrononativus amylolyticus TaxID=2963434 RepID=UPI0020CEBDEF|nr:hypothetical protein [Natrononativus amylolyticus]
MNRSLVAAGSLLGGGALLAALAVAVLEPSFAQLALVGTDWVVFAVASSALTLGIVGLARVGRSPDAAALPERATEPTREHARVTEPIDRSLDRPELEETTAEAGRRAYQRRQARAAIERAVTLTLVERHGVSEAAADRRLRDGSWTDDPRAAAYASPAVSLPLRLRLEDWAHGARRQRGLEAAIAAVDALAAGNAADETPAPTANSPEPAPEPASELELEGER